MKFLDLAKKRRTTYEFGNKVPSETKIKRLLEAGRWAPSCTNNQPWEFVVIKNKSTISKLVRTANYGDFHSDPSMMIAIVLVEKRCLGKNLSCFRGVDSKVHDSYMSCGMAALQMVLEAADMGIDSCFLTPEQVSAKKILKIKKEDALPIIVGIGYKKKGSFQKKRERINLKKLVSYEFSGGK